MKENTKYVLTRKDQEGFPMVLSKEEFKLFWSDLKNQGWELKPDASQSPLEPHTEVLET